ncbi:melanoma-associated antigen 4-like [Sorex fumeus]|uniref:melanoma-associated antigen 4-like n=1 Tax=Sorex fumeus TaxID=62283 RepID=UPI0024AD2776|nr:melanoma-associated antigen 4-like [Sorex fumeus]
MDELEGCVTHAIMCLRDKFMAFMLKDENQDLQDDQYLKNGQEFQVEGKKKNFPSYTTASVLLEDTTGEVAAAGVFSVSKDPHQSSLRASHFQGTMAATPESHPLTGSASIRQGKRLRDSDEPTQAGAFLQEALDDKITDLVGFLLFKYRTKQPTTKKEMLRYILNNDEENFSVILSHASECMKLVFGIDVKEDPHAHSYALVTTLGLTYNGRVGPQQGMPNTGLLLMVLGVIVLEDDCASEEAVWGQLGFMGVHPGRKHFIYGEPRKLLTNVWVREQYLKYQQVPGSIPAHYQFLWGPRAYAETTKMDVLDFLLKIYVNEQKSLQFVIQEPSRKKRRTGPDQV